MAATLVPFSENFQRIFSIAKTQRRWRFSEEGTGVASLLVAGLRNHLPPH